MSIKRTIYQSQELISSSCIVRIGGIIESYVLEPYTHHQEIVSSSCIV